MMIVVMMMMMVVVVMMMMMMIIVVVNNEDDDDAHDDVSVSNDESFLKFIFTLEGMMVYDRDEGRSDDDEDDYELYGG